MICLLRFGTTSLLLLLGASLTPQGLRAQDAFGTSSANPKKSVNYRFPVRHYETLTFQNRNIRVEKELQQNDPKLMNSAVKRLNKNIDEALSRFPARHRRILSAIPFVLMYGEASRNGGRKNGLAYFQKQAPQHRKWLDETWGGHIVVYSAKNYTDITEFWALKAVVHELAHAYQLEQWPEKQPIILLAYNNAMKEGLYHGITDDKGNSIAKAYAATNQLEYFAELSCMYFVGCNYDPRDRRSLTAYDPAGFAMIETMWSVNRSPKPTKFPRRTWTDASGRYDIIGQLIDSANQSVTLRKDDGSLIHPRKDQLSDVDQNYIQWSKNQ